MGHPTLDDDPQALRAWRDQTLYRLLLRASRAERTTTLRQLQALGHTDVTLADTNLLANLDTEGTTVTALARRAAVTRQAVSQQVRALERAGYVERRPSDTDGRAVVVIQTARGRALLADALDVVDRLEVGYADILTSERLAELKASLALLLDAVDPVGALGRD